MMEISVHIPDEAWEQTGPESYPELRLTAQLVINSVPFHCEAWQVDPYNMQSLRHNDDFCTDAVEEALYALNDQRLCTMALRGHDYIVVIFPHGD
jgi:hypothetical protein